MAIKLEWKWVVLLLASGMTFGGYYSFDFPSVLHNQLYRHFSAHSESLSAEDFELSFSLLFSLYSLPNMFLPLVGGVLIDKAGNDKVTCACALLVLCGNALQTYALHRDVLSLSLLLCGRAIFGLGAETLQVCANTAISKWFPEREIALAMAVNLSLCKLPSVLTDWVSPKIERERGVFAASVCVTALCVMSFVCALVLAVSESRDASQSFSLTHSRSLSAVEKKSDEEYEEEKNKKQNNKKKHRERLGYTPISDESVRGRDKESMRDDSHHVTMEIELSTLHVDLEEREDFHIHDKRSLYTRIDEETEREEEEKDTVTTLPHSQEIKSCSQALRSMISEMSSFSLSVWLLMGFTLLMYGTFIPFSNIANAVILEIFFSHSKDLRRSEVIVAGYQSVPYFLAIFLNPPLGLLVDRLGRRTALLLGSSLTLALAHMLIYWAAVGPLLALLIIGVAYSVFGSVIWPCVPVVVEEALHGTAYGTMSASMNIGQFIVPLVLQQVYRENHAFRPCELLLTGTALCASAIAVCAYYVDEKYHDGVLRKPAVLA